ncbi:hypothetical protein B0T24DRAFT_29271 [Lasiosphaeria ovina]|uniref:Uncharacterized protein n=1 Tax=Lasiosphaeria ovina TaxID=92902 RepID=A0AAE0NK59_9PEZI|nr:hypothetical protein B0T24DRAFT_29271 [Lasiosphaeria ovina]
MRRHVQCILFLLSCLSLTQAASNIRDGKLVRRGNVMDQIIGALKAAGGPGDNIEIKKENGQGQVQQGGIPTVTETLWKTMTAKGAGRGRNRTASTVYVTVTEPAGVLGAAAVDGGGGQLSFITTTIFASGPAPTVTITALASTVTQTVCPAGVQGAAQGGNVLGGTNSSAPGGTGGAAQANPNTPHGGVGVTIISLPPGTPTGVAPVASAQVTGGSSFQNTSSLVALPGLTSSSSLLSLVTLPGASASPTLVPLPGAPAAASSLVPLGGASALSTALTSTPPAAATSALATAPVAVIPAGGAASSTLNAGAGNAVLATPVAAAPGAFGGSAGVVPIADAQNPPPAAPSANPTVPAAAAVQQGAAEGPVVTPAPAVANGAGSPQLNIDVSGLTLNSQLDLGNLAQQTVSRS